jgi:hypothetical protein
MAREHTGTLLVFMAFDTIFVIGYVTLFAVIFFVHPERGPSGWAPGFWPASPT